MNYVRNTIAIGAAVCAVAVGVYWLARTRVSPPCQDVAQSEVVAHGGRLLGQMKGPLGVILVFEQEHLLFSRSDADQSVAARLGGHEVGDCMSGTPEESVKWRVWRVPGMPPGLGRRRPEAEPTGGGE